MYPRLDGYVSTYTSSLSPLGRRKKGVRVTEVETIVQGLLNRPRKLVQHPLSPPCRIEFVFERSEGLDVNPSWLVGLYGDNEVGRLFGHTPEAIKSSELLYRN